MSVAVDVAVIGAGPGSLTAAAYLASAGAKVVVLEATDVAGGAGAAPVDVGGLSVPGTPATLHALDPRVVMDLKLTRRGLRFSVRDLPLVALRADDRLMIDRDRHATANSLAQLSHRDATRFDEFRRDLFAAARALRALWWEAGVPPDASTRSNLRRLGMLSAEAMLEAAFETEAVKAACGFDALQAGISPSSAGSSLLLAWRAAQEMCGLQGAVAIPRGGGPTLASTLLQAASEAGVELRVGTKVASIHVDDDRVRAAVLATGEFVPARVILSNLSRRATLMNLLPPEAAGFAMVTRLRDERTVGEATILMTLNAVPDFAMACPLARFVMVERLDAVVAAHTEARLGRIPTEFALEAVIPTASDPGLAADTTLLCVTVRPLPVAPAGGWPSHVAELFERVVQRLSHHAPRLRSSITGLNVVLPRADQDRVTAAHIASDWPARLATPVEGLFLCGDAAEPVPAVSCRAGRLAAALASAYLKWGAP
ncbi:MAG: NAD(P)/FAD-dependent oxidoreductase [Alphaproteobacteria bacterium]|nr:NAD(P)/FAD-dependent oxidoreductase [Alphaproteobacteria bacterium]